MRKEGAEQKYMAISYAKYFRMLGAKGEDPSDGSGGDPPANGAKLSGTLEGFLWP